MWSTLRNANDEINKTSLGGPIHSESHILHLSYHLQCLFVDECFYPDHTTSICLWYSELMPIMSHSAATMGEFGNLILGKDEDKGCERLRKRIRQAKEEEEEGDDNNKVQWDTGICDESE